MFTGFHWKRIKERKNVYKLNVIYSDRIFCMRVLENRNFKILHMYTNVRRGLNGLFLPRPSLDAFFDISVIQSLCFGFTSVFLIVTVHDLSLLYLVRIGVRLTLLKSDQLDVIITLVALSLINYLHNYIDTQAFEVE